MYGVPNSSNVNDVRFYLFSKTYQSKELDDNFEKKCRSFDSSSLPPSSGWIVNDDKYDFVWFAGDQFPSSAVDIVIKKNPEGPELAKNGRQHDRQVTKMVATRLYRQDFAKLPLNHHYNICEILEIVLYEEKSTGVKFCDRGGHKTEALFPIQGRRALMTSQ
ncbi:uncharacterized protein TNCV_2820261 [Trichonephila clavipes]|nr:uncharacterized protein TNCV_2820261 [Trichonephila clavipes]